MLIDDALRALMRRLATALPDVLAWEVTSFTRRHRTALRSTLRAALPVPAPTAAPAPPGPHLIALESVIAPWKPRLRMSVAPAVRTLAAKTRQKVFYVIGTLDHLTFSGTVRVAGEINERARAMLEQVRAALDAGFQRTAVLIGSQRGFLLTRDKMALTPAGAEAVASGMFARTAAPSVDDHERDFAFRRRADAKFLVRWMATLPESTLESASALASKLNNSLMGEFFAFRRENNGGNAPFLIGTQADGGAKDWRFYPPEGHNTYQDIVRALIFYAAGDADAHWADQGRAAHQAALESKAAGMSLHDVLVDVGFLVPGVHNNRGDRDDGDGDDSDGQPDGGGSIPAEWKAP